LLTKVRNLVLANLGVFLIMFATLGLDPRTPWGMYEPDKPDCLRK